MTVNPNFPRLEYGLGAAWDANAGAVPSDRFVDVTARTQATTATQRGRQYELDQIQSGTLSATLGNVDGVLDPVNGASPYAGHIQPYMPVRVRALWPASDNLIGNPIANCGADLPDRAFVGDDEGLFSDTNSSGAAAEVLHGSGDGGGSALLCFTNDDNSRNDRIAHYTSLAVTPGQTYTFTVSWDIGTLSSTLTIKPFIAWFGPDPSADPITYVYGASNTATSTSSSVGAYRAITVTATAPANAYGMDVGIALDMVPAGIINLYTSKWHLREGAVSTPFSSGTWYPLYSGFVERWPQTWANENTYSVVQPTGVDAFAMISQVALSDPLTEEINSHSPRFLYKLDDPQGSDSAVDSTGQCGSADIAQSKYGSGVATFGTAITSADSGGTYAGSTGTVLNLTNTFPGTNFASAATFLRLTGAGITGPEDPTSFTRMVAFRYTGGSIASQAVAWSCLAKQRASGNPSGSRLEFLITAGGTPAVAVAGPSGSIQTYNNTLVFVNDGDWHLVTFSYSATAARVRISVDGVPVDYTGVSSSLTPTGLVGDNLGGFVDTTIGNGTAWNFSGDLSFASEFPDELSAAQISSLYFAWRSACDGEPTDARYRRILTYAGYSGETGIQAGLTRAMGPADFSGQDALSALQSVVDTENGAHFVAKDGKLSFRSRGDRYNAATPKWIFGERADLGELPCEEIDLDFDPTHLANIVQVTQSETSVVFSASDSASIKRYFPRTMTRTVNSQDATEVASSASYLLNRYKAPLSRVSTLILHPAANPELWEACLSMELGDRARVMRRPLGAPAIQREVFVEQIAWALDDTGNATVQLQCSPADETPYAVFTAFHTTLSAATAVGATTFKLTQPADNTMPLAAQLGAGQPLWVGNDPVFVRSVSGNTVTPSDPLLFAHSAGELVIERTDITGATPTSGEYDASAQFDNAAFTY